MARKSVSPLCALFCLDKIISYDFKDSQTRKIQISFLYILLFELSYIWLRSWLDRICSTFIDKIYNFALYWDWGNIVQGVSLLISVYLQSWKNSLKGIVTQYIFSLKTSLNEYIDVWNDSSVQKYPWKIRTIQVLDDFFINLLTPIYMFSWKSRASVELLQNSLGRTSKAL